MVGLLRSGLRVGSGLAKSAQASREACSVAPASLRSARRPGAAARRTPAPGPRWRASAAGVGQEAAQKAAAEMLLEPERVAAVLKTMAHEQQKVIATAWLDSEMEKEFKKIDKGGKGHLTYKEWRTWIKRCIVQGPQEKAKPPSYRQLFTHSFTTMVPFSGFGFVDNGLMVIYGDVIDGTLGVYLGMSMLASAALGNAISNVFGMLLHGTIIRSADRVGLPDPKLTLSQRKLPIVHTFTTLGSCAGVFFGCLSGMSPLLFMDQTKKEAERSHGKAH